MKKDKYEKVITVKDGVFLIRTGFEVVCCLYMARDHDQLLEVLMLKIFVFTNRSSYVSC